MPFFRKFRRRISAVIALATAFLLPFPVQADPAQLLHKPAPHFSRAGLDGRRVDLAAFRGKVVLLTFWATWCAPCQAEMPRFIDWQTRYGSQGFQIIAVSMDDDSKEVRAQLAEHSVNYPVLMGNVRLGRAYGGIFGLPVNFLIDRHGTVAAVFQGESDLEAIQDSLRGLLSTP